MLNKILSKLFFQPFAKRIQALHDAYLESLHEILSENRRLRAELENAHAEHKDSWFINPEYVFSVNKTGSILLNGEQITSMELKNLKAEARTFKEFSLWKVIMSTLRQKAVEKSLFGSTDLYSLKGNEQILAGKMMIFNLDIIKTIINDIEKAKLVAK